MEQTPVFPVWIPPEERPTPTIEAVPHDVLEHALKVGTRYARCPDCGTAQWFPWTPEETTSCTCSDCDAPVTVV